MDSTRLCSFLLTVITGAVFPGHILGIIPVTEKSYEQVVLPPFVDGLNSLTSVAETMLASTDLQKGIQDVCQLLESSQKSLSKAEESSLAQVKALSSNVEERLDKINRLNDEQKVLQAREQSLNVQLSGLQEQEHIARQQLQAAIEAVKNAMDAWKRANKAWREAEENRKMGKSMMYFPIFGPIGGTVTIITAEKAIQDAVKEARKAQEMQEMHDKAVKNYNSQLQSTKEAIRSTEQTIVDNTKQIKVLQQDLNSESDLNQKMNRFLIPLRKCTSLLGILAGQTSTANMYAEFSETFDGLLGVLDEIVVTVRPLVESSTDYSLLVSDKLPTIIHKLEAANHRLKKAPAS